MVVQRLLQRDPPPYHSEVAPYDATNTVARVAADGRFLCIFSVLRDEVAKSEVVLTSATSLPADPLRNILVSSVFYDRTRAPLKDIGNLRAGCNIGGAVISRPEDLRHPRPFSVVVARHPVCSRARDRYPLAPSRPRPVSPTLAPLCHPLASPPPTLSPATSALPVQAGVLTRLCSHIPG